MSHEVTLTGKNVYLYSVVKRQCVKVSTYNNQMKSDIDAVYVHFHKKYAN